MVGFYFLDNHNRDHNAHLENVILGSALYTIQGPGNYFVNWKRNMEYGNA